MGPWEVAKRVAPQSYLMEDPSIRNRIMNAKDLRPYRTRMSDANSVAELMRSDNEVSNEGYISSG